MATKRATSYRLTPTCLKLISQLAKDLGIAQTDIIEMAVRDYARRQEK